MWQDSFRVNDFTGSPCRMFLGFGRVRVKKQGLLLLPGMADIGREKWHQPSTDASHQSIKDRFGLE